MYRYLPSAYLRNLSPAKLVLWCYLIWYLCMALMHFDPNPRLWLTSVGISLVVGVGLILSVAGAPTAPDRWTVLRLFMMPFCVSSFSALVKDQGFILIFSPAIREDLLTLGVCLLFVMITAGLKWLAPSSIPAQQPMPEQ